MVFAYTKRSTDPCVPVFQEWYPQGTLTWDDNCHKLIVSTRKYLTALKGNVSWLQILVASPSTPYFFCDKREGRRISTSLQMNICADTKPRWKKRTIFAQHHFRLQICPLRSINRIYTYIFGKKPKNRWYHPSRNSQILWWLQGFGSAACNELTPYLFIMEITGTKLGRRSRHAAKLRWHHIYVGCLELVEEWPPERPL